VTVDAAPDSEPTGASTSATASVPTRTQAQGTESGTPATALKPNVVATEPAGAAMPRAGDPQPTGLVWTPGAQIFLRAEGRINPDFDAAANTPPDVAQVLERARLQLGATWGVVGGFVQLQDARNWGFEGTTSSNEANTDLHQGWMEIAGAIPRRKLSGSIRAGRQEIDWGSQRMIGSFLWAPIARSFDALRLQGTAGRWRADAFVAMLAPPGTFTVGEPPKSVQTRGEQLAAGLVSFAAHDAFNIEAMVMADLAAASMAAPTRDRRVYDFGGRLWGSPLGGLRYEAEGHGQAGRNEGLNHRAWAWAANLSYTRESKRVKPGGKIGYAMASGSRCTGSSAAGVANCGAATSSDFFNFYPTNHIHYGLVDLLGWRNMRDLEVSGSLAVDWFSASLGYHFFQLNEASGRWRDAAGGQVGSGWDTTNTDRTLGHEFDVVATLKPWKPLMVQPGYGVFLPRKAGRTLGGESPQHFVYLWLVTTF